MESETGCDKHRSSIRSLKAVTACQANAIMISRESLHNVSLPYEIFCCGSCRETVNGHRLTANTLSPVFVRAYPAMADFGSGWARSIIEPKAWSSLRRRFSKRVIVCLNPKMTARDAHVMI
jgi:hypothetical protein